MEQLPVKFKDDLEVMRGRPLTELQEAFLAEYIENDFRAKEAANSIGISVKERARFIRNLKKEMLELIEMKLVEHAGDAVRTLHELLTSEDAITQANIKLEAAKTLLDRIGITKKEQVHITHEGAVGLFVLPSKKEVVIDG